MVDHETLCLRLTRAQGEWRALVLTENEPGSFAVGPAAERRAESEGKDVGITILYALTRALSPDPPPNVLRTVRPPQGDDLCWLFDIRRTPETDVAYHVTVWDPRQDPDSIASHFMAQQGNVVSPEAGLAAFSSVIDSLAAYGALRDGPPGMRHLAWPTARSY